jgi:hypothetical protein
MNVVGHETVRQDTDFMLDGNRAQSLQAERHQRIVELTAALLAGYGEQVHVRVRVIRQRKAVLFPSERGDHI